jgi:hypothetical protein
MLGANEKEETGISPNINRSIKLLATVGLKTIERAI